MLDWLKGILGDAYTEEIDKKVSDEIGKGFVARGDFNNISGEVKQLRTQVKERDEQLEGLKKTTGDADELRKTIADLQKTNEDQTQAHEAEKKRLARDAAVDVALMKASAINLKSVKALLDMDNLEPGDDGSVKGLAEALDALQKGDDTKHLFKGAEAEPKPQGKPVGFPPVQKSDRDTIDPFIAGFDGD